MNPQLQSYEDCALPVKLPNYVNTAAPKSTITKIINQHTSIGVNTVHQPTVAMKLRPIAFKTNRTNVMI